MDTRGIEVTNQLRSAIRAKLMELGVRYDEELPDYILVMVVNKKSRQQMHDDLNLFLEDCTTVFVDWLHDQVLKKLQKVTVARKKSREFVPMVVVKQEEEKKKQRKISATSFLEDQAVDQSSGKTTARDDKAAQQKQSPAKPAVPSQNLTETSPNKVTEKTAKVVCSKGKADEAPTAHVVGHQEASSKKTQSVVGDESATRETTVSESSVGVKTGDPHRDQRISTEGPSKSLKRLSETSSGQHDSAEKRVHEAKRSKSEEEKDDASDTVRKLRSCVNKPRITSVVSVKNRLGVASQRKKFEIYREKAAIEGNGRYRQSDKRFDKHRYDNGRSGGFQRNRSFEDERSRRSRDGDSRHHETNKINDMRSRIESSKNEKLTRSVESRDNRINSGSKGTADLTKKPASTIKDRLGVVGVNKAAQKQPAKSQEAADWSRNPKSAEQTRGDVSSTAKNIKNRLGPLRNNFRPVRKRKATQSRGSEDDDCLNLGAEEEEEEEELDNDDQSAGPMKSHIVAVNRTAVVRIDRKRPKGTTEASLNATQHSGYAGHSAKSQSDKLDGRGAMSDVDEDNIDDTRLPSKVIVTPRPLKPLQPTQKRATQSLLLRAVAEANQSVVTQKNPEPSLLDKKPVLKRLKPALTRDVGQNLSVHLNSSKRLVMEKIQIELNTADNLDTEDAEPAPYVPQALRDEHRGVVMSLFQRSNDSQKFLVTLNGYNSLAKEKIGSEDDEERLEMEVNEDDEALLSTQNEAYAVVQSELVESSSLRINEGEDEPDDGDSPKEASDENNENCNTENVDKSEEIPRKRRKLSPIVYNRSQSPSPTRLKSSAAQSLPTSTSGNNNNNNNNKFTDNKRPLTDCTVLTVHLDKSRENCRYWPNCTLGNKCAYLHPPVMCSAFPACKFGDKCAYRHPKCKFGLSCTKLGCVFSHPNQQCKYHPFCTKPACPYSHPAASHGPQLATEVATSQRAKFTWRRQD